MHIKMVTKQLIYRFRFIFIGYIQLISSYCEIDIDSMQTIDVVW